MTSICQLWVTSPFTSMCKSSLYPIPGYFQDIVSSQQQTVSNCLEILSSFSSMSITLIIYYLRFLLCALKAKMNLNNDCNFPFSLKEITKYLLNWVVVKYHNKLSSLCNLFRAEQAKCVVQAVLNSICSAKIWQPNIFIFSLFEDKFVTS